MTTALYRRYRPDSFADVIGQEHVTDPLRAALRADRATHAYLFSGPRGCGKTTSARILARCLNCAEGPTDTPCGTCDSCVELARGGPGSLDVVEIDAASHGGVDDARDLRERAVFAPARDRYKVFIIDEAHMVSSQGFNALLKLVEEPPAHVKFVFATTEPEKVIGTIRSRTHHYPFRLVPPAVLQDYLAQLCVSEGIAVESGVLPLVVRAGGGSVRDSLSVLDQLLAGAGADGVSYHLAAALLGFTPSSLLDDIVSALAAGDGGAVFRVVEHVVESGQDPRRFIEDVLDRLRDLIVIAASGDAADAVLRATPADELERMRPQARALGPQRLSALADIINTGLTEMIGATSPRLQLELVLTRALVALGAFGQVASLAPVGLPAGSTATTATIAPQRPSAPEQPNAQAATAAPTTTAAPTAPERPAPAAPPTAAPPSAEPRRSTAEPCPDRQPAAPQARPEAPAAESPSTTPAAAEAPSAPPPSPTTGTPAHGIDSTELRRRWPEVLEALKGHNRLLWMVLEQAGQVAAVTDSQVTVRFAGQGPATTFASRDGVALLTQVLFETVGLKVAVVVDVGGPDDGPGGGVSSAPSGEPGGSAPADRRRADAPADRPRGAAGPRALAADEAGGGAAPAANRAVVDAPAAPGYADTADTTAAVADTTVPDADADAVAAAPTPTAPAAPQPEADPTPRSAAVERALADWEGTPLPPSPADAPAEPAAPVAPPAPRWSASRTAAAPGAPDVVARTASDPAAAPPQAADRPSSPAAVHTPAAASAPARQPAPWEDDIPLGDEPPVDDAPWSDQTPAAQAPASRAPAAQAPAAQAAEGQAAAPAQHGRAAERHLAPIIDLAQRKQERDARRVQDDDIDDLEGSVDAGQGTGLMGVPLVAKLLGGVVIDEIVDDAGRR